jgi:hypothetical protein
MPLSTGLNLDHQDTNEESYDDIMLVTLAMNNISRMSAKVEGEQRYAAATKQQEENASPKAEEE